MSSKAWVVTCTARKCVIVAFARDPQLEHGKGEVVLPPQNSCVLECICCGSAYRYSGADFVAGEPKRNPACLRKTHRQQMDGAILVAASIVTAIRLRGEPIKPSPKLTATIADSVSIARLVLAEVDRQPRESRG
jgi:hypothetical protein